ncbi:adenine-specific DNA-methyltransferase [Bradyrhizobium japonicum]|uniref:DNA-methyltransferase n=1 Tax=Bradyrhizobium japonicum TaxID=375 RepID=UPI002168BFB6|nr:site-specific DNA-methyltransferase [Bradyrhizobium japonicum]MCS3504057.1 adenine-specific DNA-methyltransferase [Bradyrhizobium japonicum]MCS3963223.1 adenine-specific DNA-methyltransferase [Bradyrhizobium japonicum]MCS3995536.1 adenine-specific DNA-methyltransferase [Bradyrhizobium japonicum]
MRVTKSVREYETVRGANAAIGAGVDCVLYRGDCFDLLSGLPDASVDLVITSPPYCLGMEYERATTVQDFILAHEKILPEVIRVTKPGGSICWQVGNHISKQAVYPLDYAVFALLEGRKEVSLRNRIIWSFAHGLHGTSRFSGRYETLLWYTKGDQYFFDLDAVRVPQKYPGKRHYKGPTKGEFSGNPLGKNPGDVWDIPNVKGNHVEKVGHPCQFPVALVQRAVRAFCPQGGVVLDPFMGSGSAGVAALVEQRRFLGAEYHKKYFGLAADRLKKTAVGKAIFRPLERPILTPNPRSQVAIVPPHFRVAAE